MPPPAGALVLFVLSALAARAGLYPDTISPGNVPWPGGVVPYVFDNLSGPHQQAYLAGLREYELAANVQFIPRTTQQDYIRFKYVPGGPNRVSGSQPQVVEIGLLTRAQICHEMGHAFGLEHEHQRPDRDAFVNVLPANIVPGNSHLFSIAPNTVAFGPYDFESVMHYGRDVLSVNPGVLDTLQAKPGFTKYQRRMGNHGLSPGDRALMAFLYGPPAVLPTSVVTTTADGGPGSLRAAIYHATDHPGTTITFNIPANDPGHAGGVFTLHPTSHLPPLVTDGTVIDASTQPGFAGSPVVFLDGSSMPVEAGSVPGILFYESGCHVKALGIRSFPWSGVAMLYPDATGNTVAGCWIGLNAAGAAAPNAFQGIHLSDGASGNVIGGITAAERNVISGNTQYGIWMSGPDTTGNAILGNYIGTNAAGDDDVANGLGGVIVTQQSHHNSIGTPVAGNVISGNVSAGIWLTGEGVDHNTIRGNRVGLNAAGTAAVPNSFVGAYVIDGASENHLEGNTFSGNISEGLRIAGAGTTDNRVEGNFAGTTADGTSALPNGFAGVTVLQGATGNRIGGPGQGNVLSGNGTVGLVIADAGTTGNFAQGNSIGTAASGMLAVPNGFAGVYLTNGSSDNHLGDGPGTCNLISGNAAVGVFIGDAATHDNMIRNNRIGPNAVGGLTFVNQTDGISISGGAKDTVVGGTEPGAANLIAGNAGRGIALFGATTAGHSFRRNSIHGNPWDGIALYDGSNSAATAPVLSSATLGLGTRVIGTLGGTPDTTFDVEFFSSSGRHFVGQGTVTTNGSGVATIDVVLPAAVPAGRIVTSTATSRANGSTSRFSNEVTVSSTDGDSDGLPDAYEASVPGLSATNTADAALDFDHDGFSNLDEFLAGTAPRDPASRLFAVGEREGANFIVSFPSAIGRSYRIDAAASPAGPWASAAIHFFGSGGVLEVSVPIAPSQPRQFFRVISGE